MSYNQLNHVISKLYRLSKSAPRRKKEFSLGLLYTHNLMQQTYCAYSGREFTDADPSSFERIDNAVGYVEGNVIAVCTSLNELRGSKSLAELEAELLKAENSLSSIVNYPDVSASFYDEKVKALLEHPHPKFDCVRGYVKCIETSKAKIERSLENIEAVEKKRLSLNAPEYNEEHIQLQLAIIERYKVKIQSAESTINGIIRKTFKNNAVKVVVKTNNANPQKEVDDLRAVVEGIKKFENLSRRQKLCVKFGIALDSSVKKLLKAWLVYNLS